MKKAFPAVLCLLLLSGCTQESVGIGIIGGADGPTKIFVAAAPFWWAPFVLIAAALIAAALLIMRKKRRK